MKEPGILKVRKVFPTVGRGGGSLGATVLFQSLEFHLCHLLDEGLISVSKPLLSSTK